MAAASCLSLLFPLPPHSTSTVRPKPVAATYLFPEDCGTESQVAARGQSDATCHSRELANPAWEQEVASVTWRWLACASGRACDVPAGPGGGPGGGGGSPPSGGGGGSTPISPGPRISSASTPLSPASKSAAAKYCLILARVADGQRRCRWRRVPVSPFLVSRCGVLYIAVPSCSPNSCQVSQ